MLHMYQKKPLSLSLFLSPAVIYKDIISLDALRSLIQLKFKQFFFVIRKHFFPYLLVSLSEEILIPNFIKGEDSPLDLESDFYTKFNFLSKEYISWWQVYKYQHFKCNAH